MKNRSKNLYLDEIQRMPNKDFLVNTFYYEKDSPGIIMPRHWHENLEFIHIVCGDVKVYLNESYILAGPGDVVVVNSNEYHGYECLSAPMSLYCAVVDCFVVNSRFYDACEIKYLQPIFNNQVFFENFLSKNQSIAHYIDDIANEFINKDTGYELAVKANIYNLLVNLLRKHVKEKIPESKSPVKKNLYEKMNIVMEYIENNYTEDITLQQMADMAGYSKYYFCKVFKKLNGKTFLEYINFMRINEALNLFNGTEMSITDIAMAIGFNDLNYFSRTFKEIIGLSPSQIRKWTDMNRLN